MKYVRNGRLIEVISASVPSRAAIAGNPSDLAEKVGIGAVLSVPVEDFKASAALVPGENFYIQAPKSVASSLGEAVRHITSRGVGDWEILVDTTLHVGEEMLKSKGISMLDLPASLHLDSDIPRQRGMSGSSGMVIAILAILAKAHDCLGRFSPEEMAKWALFVEEKIGITAGLQDRVLQSYAVIEPSTEAVFMDFSREAKAKNDGENYYQSIKIGALRVPKMALILSDQPSHSGGVHEPIKRRILAGDSEILDRMSELARYAHDAKDAFKAGNWSRLGKIMNNNAEMRVQIYGSAVLGLVNLAMLDACRVAECPANFTGSGGALVALLLDREESLPRLRDEVAKAVGNQCTVSPLN